MIDSTYPGREAAIEVAKLAPESSTAIVSRAFPSGEDASQAFADSLAAGAWAAATGWPSLLTSTDALPETIRQALADSDIERVMLLGGTAAVSPAVEEELESLGVDVVRVDQVGERRHAIARFQGVLRADQPPDLVQRQAFQGQFSDMPMAVMSRVE